MRKWQPLHRLRAVLLWAQPFIPVHLHPLYVPKRRNTGKPKVPAALLSRAGATAPRYFSINPLRLESSISHDTRSQRKETCCMHDGRRSKPGTTKQYRSKHDGIDSSGNIHSCHQHKSCHLHDVPYQSYCGWYQLILTGIEPGTKEILQYA